MVCTKYCCTDGSNGKPGAVPTGFDGTFLLLAQMFDRWKEMRSRQVEVHVSGQFFFG
jgi:hypothetical protein